MAVMLEHNELGGSSLPLPESEILPNTNHPVILHPEVFTAIKSGSILLQHYASAPLSTWVKELPPPESEYH